MKTAEIEDEDTFCDPIYIERGPFNVSIWGTFAAVVSVQRSFDGGATYRDVQKYASPHEDSGLEPEGAMYRVGVAEGAFTSGAVNVRIGQ